MKSVIRMWSKAPLSALAVLFSLLTSIGYSYLDAKFRVGIGSIFDSTDPMTEVKRIIILSIGLIVLSGIPHLLKVVGNITAYGKVMDYFYGNLLYADYNLFTKKSYSKINLATDFITDGLSFGISALFISQSIAMMAINIVEIIKISGIFGYYIVGAYMVSAIIFRIIYIIFNKIDASSRKIMRSRSQEAENAIIGFAEVRLFSKEDGHKKSMESANHKIRSLKIKKIKWITLLESLAELLEKASIIGAISYTLKMVADGSITAGVGISVIMLITNLISPLIIILDIIQSSSESLSKAPEYDELMAMAENRTPDGNIKLNDIQEGISINNITFAYDDSASVINNLSMDIRKGEKIGICGESGTGKTTLIKLLLRFYRPSKGSIKIDGIDINDLTAKSFYNKVGAVLQETNLLPGSIKENLLYASPNSSEFEMIEACKKANIYEFIMGLENKFETEIGPRGLKLSGGQKQRISLARMFLRNPEIIILDEATSALDNMSETLVKEAIDNIGDNKTVITIAHRLSTIKDCDCIYVVGKSGIVEFGSHEDLMQKKGVYYRMHK